MARDQYTWLGQTDFSGGVNLNEEEAEPNQVADSRNMWLDNGFCSQRPGYAYIGGGYVDTQNKTSGAITAFADAGGGKVTVTSAAHNVGAAPVHITEAPNYLGEFTASDITADTFNIIAPWLGDDATGTWGIASGVTGALAITHPAAAGAMTLSSAAVGTYWYLGFSSVPDNATLIMIGAGTTNSNAVVSAIEYWNGAEWQFAGNETASTSTGLTDKHLGNFYSLVGTSVPTNWAASTVEATAVVRYWLRFRLINNGDTTLDASVTVNFTPGAGPFIYTVEGATGLKGMYGARFPGGRWYLRVGDYPGTGASVTGTEFRVVQYIGVPTGGNYILLPKTSGDEPASFITIPEYGRAFGAYGYDVVEFDPEGGTVALAQAETAIDLVGTMAGQKMPYHPDYIATLGAVPKAKYLEYFDGQLWAANIQDNPYLLYWSAPEDAFRIWPAVSGLTVMEDDPSPITGLRAFGEHLAVFKQDSIWRIVHVGEDGLTGLNTYTAVKVPGNIGCVSNSSIVNVNGVTIFLAEDGVYAFDGVSKPEKLSGAIDDLISSIDAGRRKFSCAENWSTKNCYILAVAVDGSEVNNLVLVYDYSVGAWWVWDNIEAQCWMRDEDEFDNEELYFGDRYGRIYRLGEGDLDNGAAITSYVQTHRLAPEDESTKSFRQVRIYGEGSELASMDIKMVADDADRNAVTGIVDWRSSLEVKVGATTLVDDSDPEVTYMSRRDKVKLDFRKTGDWATVRVTNDERGHKMALRHIKVGVTSHGIR